MQKRAPAGMGASQRVQLRSGVPVDIRPASYRRVRTGPRPCESIQCGTSRPSTPRAGGRRGRSGHAQARVRRRPGHRTPRDQRGRGCGPVPRAHRGLRSSRSSGTWVVDIDTATTEDPPGLLTINADGTLRLTSCCDAPGAGAWRPTTRRTADATLLLPFFDDEGFIGFSIARADVVLSIDGSDLHRDLHAGDPRSRGWHDGAARSGHGDRQPPHRGGHRRARGAAASGPA